MRIAIVLACGVGLLGLGCADSNTGLPPDPDPVIADLGVTSDFATTQLSDLTTSTPDDLTSVTRPDGSLSPVPPADVAPGPALNLVPARLAAAEFDLAGVAPDGSFVAVTTHDQQGQLQIFDAAGKSLAQLDNGAKVLAIAAGGNVYYSVGTTLRAWWPARGAGNALTLSGSLKQWTGASPDGLWVLFQESTGNNTYVVRYGRRDQALETIPNATRAQIAPVTGHVYTEVAVKNTADSVIRIPHGQPVAAAQTECTDCWLEAISTDGVVVATMRTIVNRHHISISSTGAAASATSEVWKDPDGFHRVFFAQFGAEAPVLVLQGADDNGYDFFVAYDYQQETVLPSTCHGDNASEWYAGIHQVCTHSGGCTDQVEIEGRYWLSSEPLAAHREQYALRVDQNPNGCGGGVSNVVIVVRGALSSHTLPKGAGGPIVWTDAQHLLYQQGTTLMRLDMSGQTWTTSTVAGDVSDYLFNEPSRRVFFVTRGVSQQKDGLYVVTLP